MVAGKTSPQTLARTATTAAGTAPKLPPLPKLRIRKPNRADANPCIGVMSSVLGTLSLLPLYAVWDGGEKGGERHHEGWGSVRATRGQLVCYMVLVAAD